MTRKLIILGAGGGVCDILDVVDAINARRPTWTVIGLLDDAATGMRFGHPVLGGLRDARTFQDCSFISSIRSERSFASSACLIGELGLERDAFATLIHPCSAISPRTTLGAGVHVNFGVSVGGAGQIGDHVFLGPNAIIGHETIIQEHVTIAAGAIVSGRVTIEPGTYIGTGARIRQLLTVGSGALVGMGAVVVKSVPPRTVVAGNPGRTLRTIGQT